MKRTKIVKSTSYGTFMPPTFELVRKVRSRVMSLEGESLQDLVDCYNLLVGKALMGEGQGILLLALHEQFNRRTGQSPVSIISHCIIDVTKPVVIKDGVLWYADGMVPQHR